TLLPFAASSRATAIPAGPAPTTQTSPRRVSSTESCRASMSMRDHLSFSDNMAARPPKSGLSQRSASCKDEGDMLNALRMLGEDLREKARWCYKSDDGKAIAKVLATDGTLAMVLYRLMQGSRESHLAPLEMVFNKL